MKLIVFPENTCRRLAFYLAAEEWVAKTLPAADYFFTWKVRPTVIIGRNQDIWSEVNLAYCRDNAIDVCRRRSGGGCVYADDRNIMISYISPDTDVSTVFQRYTGMVSSQLRKMGFDATPSGRNDILIDGRKISGSAFYLLSDRSIVHSTMLYQTDLTNMLNAITPSRAKLESKKVKSVQSRIVTASEIRPSLGFEQFHSGLVNGLADSRYYLNANDIKEITKIEKKYYDSDWLLYGETGRRQNSQLHRIDRIGTVSIRPVVNEAGEILDISIVGDCFVIGDMNEVYRLLQGCRLDASSLTLRMADIDMGNYISNMTNNTFIELLTQS
ncbi:MAG: lipoate--protein ligase [Muribaculaceae bacterium]|nr:lipoate--protein ligase [Muribaculaceae bacterium]